MKKLILVALMMVGLFTIQPSEVKAQGALTVSTMTSDTGISNTTPGYSTSSAYTNGYEVVTIQPLVTKFSGTVAGKAELQGSLDGTNYINIASDTMALTNVATVQTYLWVVTPSKYKYYRIKYTGVGTMHIRVVGKIGRFDSND